MLVNDNTAEYNVSQRKTITKLSTMRYRHTRNFLG